MHISELIPGHNYRLSIQVHLHIYRVQDFARAIVVPQYYRHWLGGSEDVSVLDNWCLFPKRIFASGIFHVLYRGIVSNSYKWEDLASSVLGSIERACSSAVWVHDIQSAWKFWRQFGIINSRKQGSFYSDTPTLLHACAACSFCVVHDINGLIIASTEGAVEDISRQNIQPSTRLILCSTVCTCECHSNLHFITESILSFATGVFV